MLAGIFSSASASADNSWRITPSIGLTETFTDNFALAPNDRKESDLITQISPGISVVGNGGRVKLNLNYRMTGVLYADHSQDNNIQNYLSATGNVEAIKNWLFVDATASISQTALSAFGSQPVATGQANVNANRAETRAFSLSPYIRGKLDATTDYTVRYRYSLSSVRSSQIPDTEAQEFSGNLRGVVSSIRRLNWALDASNAQTHSQGIQDTETSRLRGSLTYQFDPQLRFTASGGYERNNYTGVNQDGATYGGGFDWTPTNRTQVSGYFEKRPVADTHTFSARHRTARTTWSYTDNKSVTTLANQLATVGTATAFDLLFNQLTTQIPDPVLRAQEVNTRLQQSGIPPDLLLPRSFVTTSVYETHSRVLSVAFLGLRNTLTLAASLTDSQSLSQGLPVTGDFSSASEIKQRGLTADWSHRISPLTSLNIVGSQYHSTGNTGQESTQYVARAQLTRTLGKRTNGSLAARWTRFEGTTSASDYTEKALVATVFMTF